MSTPTKEDWLQPGATPLGMSRIQGQVNAKEHSQATAANGTADLLWHATFDGNITDALVQLSAVVGAGESMTYNLLLNGASILMGGTAITVNATNGLAKAQIDLFGSIDPTKKSFVKGDVLAVTRAYTAGGTPTPLARNTVRLEVAPIAFGPPGK